MYIVTGYTYTELLKKPDAFYLLQTRKKQKIIELSRYAYFNKKTLESIL